VAEFPDHRAQSTACFRANLEEDRHVLCRSRSRWIALAHAKDMLTTPYVFCAGKMPKRWRRRAPDIIVCHLSALTSGGAIGARTGRGPCTIARRWSTNGPRLALANQQGRESFWRMGGPVAEPEDAEYILRAAQALPWLLRGIFNGTPADPKKAMTEQTRKFKAIALG